MRQTEIFSSGVPGVWEMFTTLQAQQGKFAELDIVDGIPQIREWLGSRQLKNLRAYALTKPIRAWEMSIGVPVDDINGDRTGVVAQRLRDFAARGAAAYDQILVPFLQSNPVGYDDVALFSAAHPTEAGTQDNLTTGAINYAAYRTGRAAMRQFTDFRGEPLGIVPTHLMVGPDQEEVAMQVTGSDKIVGIDASGDLGGTIVDAGVIRNYIGGDANVIVSERISGNAWFMFDLSKGRAKPLYAAEFLSPRTDIFDDPKDPNVFFEDEVIYGMTAKLTPMAMNWQTCYGNPTGA